MTAQELYDRLDGDELRRNVSIVEPEAVRPALAITAPAFELDAPPAPRGLRLLEAEEYCQAVIDLFYDGVMS